MDRKIDLSIVIPCYCSVDNIAQVLDEIDSVLKPVNICYEVIMVNDASPDRTYPVISRLAKERENTIAVDLAKNAGQHGALMAGFHYARGKYIATCEDDGQTPVELLPQMLEKLQEGYDVAAPKYKKEPQKKWIRRFGSWMSAEMGKKMIPRPEGISVPIYFAARRFVIEEILNYPHSYPYMTGLILRTTYHIGNIDAERKERNAGESGYSFRKLLALWMNGFTAFSIKPLRYSIFLGVFSAAAGIIGMLAVIIRKILGIHVLLGWSSIIAIMLFMFGIVLVVLGMIGEYVGRIYMCMNRTPQYVVRRSTLDDAGEADDE